MPAGLRATLSAAALLSLTAAATAPAQEIQRSTTADVIALAVCVIDADIRTAAIAQQQRGATRDAALAAVQQAMPDRVYRAQAERLVDEVYRLRPASLRAHVSQRLQQCAAQAARRVEPAAADGCYQLTRYASDFFAARAAGVALDDTIASIGAMLRAQGLDDGARERLARLAASVYRTAVEAPDFRAGLFFHCVKPSQASPAAPADGAPR